MKNSALTKIFDELDSYREFCVDYGYNYNPADLYKRSVQAWREYEKHLRGEVCKDNWAIDAQHMYGASSR